MKSQNTTKRETSKRAKAPRRPIAPRGVRRAVAIEDDAELEPEVPVAAMLEIADWVLDLARTAAYDDADDIEIVERVRGYVHARAHGLPARAPAESELLTTVALAVSATEQRHGIAGLGELVAESLDGDVRVVRRERAACCGARRSPRVASHLYCVP